MAILIWIQCWQDCGNLQVNAKMRRGPGGRLLTSFMLTAIKRVCRTMRDIVSPCVCLEGYFMPISIVETFVKNYSKRQT